MGGSLITLAFLVLGAELLRPEGIVPSGIAVAEDLTRLFSDLWGRFGYWLLLVSIVVAFWGTVIANQDGWGRLLADATVLLSSGRLQNRAHLKKAYIVVIGGILPWMVVAIVKDPVEILSVGGIIAAAHTPVVVFLTLYLNRTRLPQPLRPGSPSVALLAVSGIFYAGFAVLYLLDWIGLKVV